MEKPLEEREQKAEKTVVLFELLIKIMFRIMITVIKVKRW